MKPQRTDVARAVCSSRKQVAYLPHVHVAILPQHPIAERHIGFKKRRRSGSRLGMGLPVGRGRRWPYEQIVLRRGESAFTSGPKFTSVCAPPRFVEGTVCTAEPLVMPGEVSGGEIVSGTWNSRSALEAA